MTSILRIIVRKNASSYNKQKNLVKHFSKSANRPKTYTITNHDDFLVKVMRNDKPVIVNFHADWCEPCKILTPELKKLVEPLEEIDLAVVDVEENAELVDTFEVKAVPAVIAVRDGLVVDKFIGLTDTTVIKQLLDKLQTS